MSSTEKRGGGGLFLGGYGYCKAGNIGGNYIWWLETSELDDNIEVCHTIPKLDSIYHLICIAEYHELSRPSIQ